MDDGLRGLAPENGGHGRKRFEGGGEFFVTAFSVGGDGVVAGGKFGGRGDGEFGVVIANAIEGEFDGSAGRRSPSGTSSPTENFRGLGGIGMDAEENVEGFVLSVREPRQFGRARRRACRRGQVEQERDSTLVEVAWVYVTGNQSSKLQGRGRQMLLLTAEAEAAGSSPGNELAEWGVKNDRLSFRVAVTYTLY